jgi:phosphomannomutase
MAASRSPAATIPADYNGFKMVLQHLPFFGEDIQKLGKMAAEGDWEETGTGKRQRLRYPRRLCRIA